MADEREPVDEREEEVEDLDVPESESEEVKGGRPLGCATGKHIKKATLEL